MKKLKILIVEDESIIAYELKLKLQSNGYEVVGTVATGTKAIEYSKKYHPDLILMDIKLSGPMDGIEATEIIKAQTETKVVYLTAFSDKTLLERAKQSKPHSILFKATDEHLLLDVLAQALKGKKAGKNGSSSSLNSN